MLAWGFCRSLKVCSMITVVWDQKSQARSKEAGGSRNSSPRVLDYMKMWVHSSHCHCITTVLFRKYILPHFPKGKSLWREKRVQHVYLGWGLNFLVILLNHWTTSFLHSYGAEDNFIDKIQFAIPTIHELNILSYFCLIGKELKPGGTAFPGESSLNNPGWAAMWWLELCSCMPKWCSN